MNRKVRALALAGCCALLAACGSTAQPQKGCLTLSGVCKSAQSVTTKELQHPAPNTFPDVWEGDPYVVGHRPTVIRLAYGNHFEDRHAGGNAARLHAWHEWVGGYVYLTGNGCTAEGAFAVSVLHLIGNVQVVIADAEIPLPRGYVRCFLRTVQAATGDPVATYSGCYSGDERYGPAWIPAYGARPVCGPYKAWQDTESGVCGEPWAGDCSINYGLLSIGRPDKRRVERWRRERRALLRRIGDECHPSSGPRCATWKRREHRLWVDINNATKGTAAP